MPCMKKKNARTVSAVVQKVRESKDFYTLFFQAKKERATVELRRSILRNLRKPRPGDLFTIEQTFDENGELLTTRFFVNEKEIKPKPLMLGTSKKQVIMERRIEIVFIEKKGEQLGIWPRYATPFSLPAAIFGDKLPKAGEEIIITENEQGVITTVTYHGQELQTVPAPEPSVLKPEATPGIRP